MKLYQPCKGILAIDRPTTVKQLRSFIGMINFYRDFWQNILFGARIRVRTDHKNLTQRDLKSQRLLHWRLLLEEFAPTFEYLPGEENVVADTLSRLPMKTLDPDLNDDDIDSMLFESLLYYPEDIDTFPLTFENISAQQQADASLLPLADQDDYDLQVFHGTELICKQDDDQWRIVIPESLIDPAIKWYHAVLGHCVISRLEKALRTHLWIPNLSQRVQQFVSTCDTCQRNKHAGPGYGHLPPREDTAQPWEEVAVDTIGPWSVDVANYGHLQVYALTIVDTATTLSETVRTEIHADCAHTTMMFENTWLARYPKPLRCIHDRGGEFKGLDFNLCCYSMALKMLFLLFATHKLMPSVNVCTRLWLICSRLHFVLLLPISLLHWNLLILALLQLLVPFVRLFIAL